MKKFLQTKRFFLEREMTIAELLDLLSEILISYLPANQEEYKFMDEWDTAISAAKKQPSFYFHSNGYYEQEDLEYFESCLLHVNSGMLTILHKKQKNNHSFPIATTGTEKIDGFAILPPWAREEDKNEKIENFLKELARCSKTYCNTIGIKINFIEG
jgi:hypothetical protein